MMNDLTECAREEQGGTRVVEQVLAFETQTTEPFDRRRRLAASTTERRLKRHEAGPAFRTCPSPPALLNRNLTMDTCDWEQEIEYVVEQSASGETQRAKSV